MCVDIFLDFSGFRTIVFWIVVPENDKNYCYFEINTKENDNKKAKAKVEEMCTKLLANLVIEDYKIIESQ